MNDDQTNNKGIPMNDPEASRDARIAGIDSTLSLWSSIRDRELPYMKSKPPADTIDIYLVDDVFDCDIRGLLADMLDEGFDIKAFLIAAESNRTLDLLRCYERLMAANRSEISRLRMRYSLCPMHGFDWAICFDDEDPECAAIRTCFPNEHDT